MDHRPHFRRRFRHHSEIGDIPNSLSALSSGRTGVVSHFHGDREFIARITGLGFSIGAPVTVLQNYGHGPMIVSLLGAHIALGRGEARKIQVQPQ